MIGAGKKPRTGRRASRYIVMMCAPMRSPTRKKDRPSEKPRRRSCSRDASRRVSPWVMSCPRSLGIRGGMPRCCYSGWPDGGILTSLVEYLNWLPLLQRGWLSAEPPLAFVPQRPVVPPYLFSHTFKGQDGRLPRPHGIRQEPHERADPPVRSDDCSSKLESPMDAIENDQASASQHSISTNHRLHAGLPQPSATHRGRRATRRSSSRALDCNRRHPPAKAVGFTGE